MGTNLEASKPVLVTYSSPVIPVLTTEALDAGALAGCARSVYADPALTLVHCGSQGVVDRGGWVGGGVVVAGGIVVAGGVVGTGSGVVTVAVGSPDSERMRGAFFPATSAHCCWW